MGHAQSEFLLRFKTSFTQRFSQPISWVGGQVAGNVAQLPSVSILRRDGVLHRMEQFEIGDLRADFGNRTLIIEYEQTQLALSNLLKYWPYIRGELSLRPQHPIVLCHFSNWWSYGSYRDLWNWVMLRMQTDAERIVDIYGHQFDHGGPDIGLRDKSVHAALDWIEQVCASETFAKT